MDTFKSLIFFLLFCDVHGEIKHDDYAIFLLYDEIISDENNVKQDTNNNGLVDDSELMKLEDNYNISATKASFDTVIEKSSSLDEIEKEYSATSYDTDESDHYSETSTMVESEVYSKPWTSPSLFYMVAMIALILVIGIAYPLWLRRLLPIDNYLRIVLSLCCKNVEGRNPGTYNSETYQWESESMNEVGGMEMRIIEGRTRMMNDEDDVHVSVA